jgi:ClpP class serine protease
MAKPKEQFNSDLNIWGAEKTFLLNYLNNRALHISKSGDENGRDLKAFIDSQNQEDNLDNILKINGDTADILITGRLNNDGPDFWDYMFGWGGTSYLQIIAAADKIDENPAIKNINLRMNTPGGLFEGVDNVWKRLMTLRESKHITAINEGLLASAGYYIASAAHEIYSTSETNESGSIGVIVAGTDWSKYDEKAGIKDVVIVSKNAPDKYVDIGTKKGKNILQERVDIAEEFFLDRISKGRGITVDHVTENFGRGALLYSQTINEDSPDALAAGMIDKVLNPISIKNPQKIKESVKKSALISPKIQQEKNMTLSELLAANPEAKAELDRQLQAKHDSGLAEGEKKGEKKGLEKSVKTAEQVFTYLKDDSPYATNAGIQRVAIDVLKGEQPLSNLKLAVSMFDEKGEKQKSDDAKAETQKHGETPPDHSPQNSEGKISDETALNTEVDKLKGLIFPGLKPKSDVA